MNIFLIEFNKVKGLLLISSESRRGEEKKFDERRGQTLLYTLLYNKNVVDPALNLKEGVPWRHPQSHRFLQLSWKLLLWYNGDFGYQYTCNSLISAIIILWNTYTIGFGKMIEWTCNKISC